MVRRQLNKIGALECVSKAGERYRARLAWVHQRLDEQLPGYYEKTSAYLEPYLVLAKELGLIAYNIIVNVKNAIADKIPLVVSVVSRPCVRKKLPLRVCAILDRGVRAGSSRADPEGSVCGVEGPGRAVRADNRVPPDPSVCVSIRI